MAKIKTSKSVKTTVIDSPKSWATSVDIAEDTRVLKSFVSGSTKASKSFKSKLVKSAKAKSSKVPKTKIIKTKSSGSLGGESAKSVKARSRRYLKKAKSVISGSAKSLKNWSRM